MKCKSDCVLLEELDKALFGDHPLYFLLPFSGLFIVYCTYICPIIHNCKECPYENK